MSKRLWIAKDSYDSLGDGDSAPICLFDRKPKFTRVFLRQGEWDTKDGSSCRMHQNFLDLADIKMEPGQCLEVQVSINGST